MNSLSSILIIVKKYFSHRNYMRIVLIAAVCLVPTFSVLAGNTIFGSFDLSVSWGEKTNVSNGIIYYNENKSLKIRVSSPNEQWMIFEGDTLYIYYPSTNSGMKIPSIKGEVTLPIFQLAVNASTEDAGLADAGYKLEKTSVSGDSIIAEWAPPEAARSILGDLTSVYIQDSLISIASTNPKGENVLQQTYTHWIANKGRFFPCRVKSTNTASDVVVIESIEFSDVILSSELPPEADEILIPPDAVMTTIEM